MYDYYCMTQAELYYKTEGFKRNERAGWEKTKALAYTIHVHNVDKKNRLRYEKFWPLDEKKEGVSDDFLKRYWEKKKRLIEQDAK